MNKKRGYTPLNCLFLHIERSKNYLSPSSSTRIIALDSCLYLSMVETCHTGKKGLVLCQAVSSFYRFGKTEIHEWEWLYHAARVAQRGEWIMRSKHEKLLMGYIWYEGARDKRIANCQWTENHFSQPLLSCFCRFVPSFVPYIFMLCHVHLCPVALTLNWCLAHQTKWQAL